MSEYVDRVMELMTKSAGRSGYLGDYADLLEELHAIVSAIPGEQKDQVVQELETELRDLDIVDLALAICLFGPEAKQALPQVLQTMESHSNAPSVFAILCDGLCARQESLPDILPQIIAMFKKTVATLPTTFSQCTNEADRFAVGVEMPCGLVRVLSACGPVAADALPSLKEYRSFLMGKQFIQTEITVLDLTSGEVASPPASPTGLVKEAIRKIKG